jgi:predicted  nucleic acid-binding Zn-ribbon protein
MYRAANLELQTATNETLNDLTVQFDQFKTEVIANFREVGKRMIGLRKHLDKIENCQTSLKERLITLDAEQNQILRSITTLRKDMGQIGDRVTDVNNKFENLEQNFGDEDSVTSSEKDGQQSHVSDLVALKSGFDNLQKSFDILRKKFEHSKNITLLLRTEVSHIKDRLGDSEGESADSELETSSDDSDHAAFLHEQGRTSLFENRVDWTEKDEEKLNDLLEKDWTTLKFFDDSSEAVGEGEALERLEDERKDES